MSVLGLDVGGANLKAADARGAARSLPFALWKDPAGLADALRRLLSEMPAFDRLAVTMTGELCDCYETKRQGVLAILDAVTAAAAGVRVEVWTLDGRFVDVDAALAEPLKCAAANWLALATFAGRFAPRGPALLFDVGSTTTDLIPLRDGKPAPRGRTDPERLRSGELIYTGVRRTPLCVLMWGDGAAELFATTHDLYLALGWVAEDPADRDTADGRPSTKRHARARIARMLCADLETCDPGDLDDLIDSLRGRHLAQLTEGLETVAGRLASPPRAVIVAGSGEFLARRVLRRQKTLPPRRTVTLARKLGPEASAAACAHAVAVMAEEANP